MRKIAALGTLGSFLVLLVAAGLGKCTSNTLVQGFTQVSRKDVLNSAVGELNKSLPKMMDVDLRADSVESSPDGKTAIYSYTLVRYSLDQVSSADMAAFRQGIVNFVCTNQATNLLSKGFAVDHRVRSNDGRLLEEIVIGPGKCILDPFDNQYGVAP